MFFIYFLFFIFFFIKWLTYLHRNFKTYKNLWYIYFNKTTLGYWVNCRNILLIVIFLYNEVHTFDVYRHVLFSYIIYVYLVVILTYIVTCNLIIQCTYTLSNFWRVSSLVIFLLCVLYTLVFCLLLSYRCIIYFIVFSLSKCHTTNDMEKQKLSKLMCIILIRS